MFPPKLFSFGSLRPRQCCPQAWPKKFIFWGGILFRLSITKWSMTICVLWPMGPKIHPVKWLLPIFEAKKWGHRITRLFHVFLMDNPLSVTIPCLCNCPGKMLFWSNQIHFMNFSGPAGPENSEKCWRGRKMHFFWLDIGWCVVSWLLRVLLASSGQRYQTSRTYAYPQCLQFYQPIFCIFSLLSPLWQSVNKFLVSLKCCRNWGMRLARFTLFLLGCGWIQCQYVCACWEFSCWQIAKTLLIVWQARFHKWGQWSHPTVAIVGRPVFGFKRLYTKKFPTMCNLAAIFLFPGLSGQQWPSFPISFAAQLSQKKWKWPFWTPLGPKAPHLESLVPYNSILWLHFCWQPYWHRCGVQKWKVIHLPSSPSIFSLQPQFPASFGMTAKKPRFWVRTGEFTEDRNFHGCVFIHNGVKTPFYNGVKTPLGRGGLKNLTLEMPTFVVSLAWPTLVLPTQHPMSDVHRS